ncbi:hypothetical protein WA556_003588, partial [Blastocystis sp. ATCC 50177/Nand II]
MKAVSLFFLLSLLSVAYCKCYGMYTECSSKADLSMQQHIKNGIPQHQDYVINNYSDEACKSISVSLLWHQPLECKEAEPRVFNCNSTVESVWVKVLDKEILQGILAPCAYLFKDKYVDVAKHDCIVNGEDQFKDFKQYIGKKEYVTIKLNDKGAPLHKDWLPVNGKCEWRYEIDGLWSSIVITLTVIIGVLLIAVIVFTIMVLKRRNESRQKL